MRVTENKYQISMRKVLDGRDEKKTCAAVSQPTFAEDKFIPSDYFKTKMLLSFTFYNVFNLFNLIAPSY